MFIVNKEIINHKTGKIYNYLQLMETIQTEEGPRTRMLVHIGNFDLTIEEQKILALIIENKIKGVNVVKFSDKLEEIATKVFIKYNNKTNEHKPTEPEKQKCSFPEIDLYTSKIDSSRFTGSELVGLEFW